MYLEVNWHRPIVLGLQSNFYYLATYQRETPKGVYVIWAEETPSVVYVGSSGDNVFERFKYHLTDDRSPVKRYKDLNPNVTLKATYAEVGEENRLGIENYLAYIYEPTLGENIPDFSPREVNLPGIPPRVINTLYSPDNNPTMDDIKWDMYEKRFNSWALAQHGKGFAGPER